MGGARIEKSLRPSGFYSSSFICSEHNDNKITENPNLEDVPPPNDHPPYSSVEAW